MFDCLVCGKQAAATHMGLNTCRSCAVFYKRRCENGEKLVCIRGKNQCNLNGQKTNGRTCRKCRLGRVAEVLRAASKDLACAIPEPSCDEDGILNVKSSAPENSIMEKIRVNYRTLSDFRMCAELRRRGININPAETNETKYELIPSTYQSWNEGMKIKFDGLFKFVPAVFPEFNTLPDSDKLSLICNYRRCFHLLDSSLLARTRFGNEPMEIFFTTYTTYTSLDSVATFFNNCPDQSNIVAASNAIYECIRELLSVMNSQNDQIDPSEFEFLALIGLALWSFETFEPSELLQSLASRYRAEIISELHAHYRSTIGEEQGASRVGLLLCMLQEYRRAVMNLPVHYEIFHMLGAFDDDTLTYKLQTMDIGR